MILVQNHQQQLSGNKSIVYIILFLFIAGCTPKVVQKPVIVKKEKEIVVEKSVVTPFNQAKLSVLIPFKLVDYNLATVTKSQISKADLALDFYQGLMLGIDSASNSGLDFKINVFDTEDDNSKLNSIIKRRELLESNLIIGPVFPDQIRLMNTVAATKDLHIVSPLAASKPSDFHNPRLISIVNDIETHAERIAKYIVGQYSPANSIVVLINTQKADDNSFAIPIKEYIKKHQPSLQVQEYSSTFIFETKMQIAKKYAVIICSDDNRFVSPSLAKLYRLKNNTKSPYQIEVFGHPNWAKQNYKYEQLQNLNTIISSSYYIDYKNKRTIDFIRNYRNKYKFEPSEYAFKGFDIGFYFSSLIVKHGEKYTNYLLQSKYQGLHNDFKFAFDPRNGYYNTAIQLLKYQNNQLKLVED